MMNEDIVTRLKTRASLVSTSCAIADLLDEAAAEIARLRVVISNRDSEIRNLEWNANKG